MCNIFSNNSGVLNLKIIKNPQDFNTTTNNTNNNKSLLVKYVEQ